MNKDQQEIYDFIKLNEDNNLDLVDIATAFNPRIIHLTLEIVKELEGLDKIRRIPFGIQYRYVIVYGIDMKIKNRLFTYDEVTKIYDEGFKWGKSNMDVGPFTHIDNFINSDLKLTTKSKFIKLLEEAWDLGSANGDIEVMGRTEFDRFIKSNL